MSVRLYFSLFQYYFQEMKLFELYFYQCIKGFLNIGIDVKQFIYHFDVGWFEKAIYTS